MTTSIGSSNGVIELGICGGDDRSEGPDEHCRWRIEVI